MKVVDPGHDYYLSCLDVDHLSLTSRLTFVKREGPGYPGNIGHHSGTTIQEVLRVLIDRIKYVDNQIPDSRNESVLTNLRHSILQLEIRAAERHGRDLYIVDFDRPIEEMPVCSACGHIGCPGDCH